ncbi:MAG: AMP-binding protein [Candidatus Omnitrophota bacterium]|jgi:long-chain acyl-CoA synthetase
MSEPDFNNLSIHEIMESINKRWFSKTALQIKTKDGWSALSYVPLGERAVDVSSTLLKLGMQKGDRAAILSESRPEWGIALFGIISCGGIVVPIDAKLSEKETEFILDDSGAKFIFVSERHLPAIDNIRPKLAGLKQVFLLDDSPRNDIIKIKDLKMKEGDRKYLPLEAEDTAVIVYTSGTTGVAKGVELTYKNLMFQAKELNRLVNYTEGDNFLSMLPLNHMLEMTGGLLSPLYVGATITYCDSLKPANIIALMNETRTTVMITVPLILKIFHDGIMKKAQSLPFLQRHFFFACLHLCRFMLRLNIKPGKAVFGRIHGQFGRHLRCFVSGGAPLDQAVEMDFNAMGFTILQGYGLTETSPVIAVNTFKELKYGSVGKPIPGVEVKLMKPDGTFGEEGEIVTRGDHVMKGYYRNPEKTAEIIKDGWLHTGDIGKFDKDGFLYITGRIRNLIVLGGGKKVFPEEIEEVMSASPYIKEICVLGKIAAEGLKAGTEEVFAVIVPNLERFEGAAKKDKELIRKKIEAEVSRLSGNLAEYKKISGLMLYFDELPKTSTRKIKRKAVVEIIASGVKV